MQQHQSQPGPDISNVGHHLGLGPTVPEKMWLLRNDERHKHETK